MGACRGTMWVRRRQGRVTVACGRTDEVGEDDATSSSRGGGDRVLVLVVSWARARAHRRVVLVALSSLLSSLHGGEDEATGDGDSDGAHMQFVSAWRGRGAV